ncbi:pilus assembly PilX N-terminal domain-containing protein [Geoalkalibacter halelectricus]|uniref:Pilus assembly PilX N-terminal domain-containing protein n=1 Tax=Geoalkalibacter halelectricus TaxID=2847045 RepID=A0ABY5ZQR7_9BACT|nr:pilus assembly PilX N-terminal domain-containing protein [Geoalkalibacter halelectricus]MDO3376791.1 pilus assembly PilX N-terminal domain-containing protein [Geoalkalibacter halelectricus]UWZ79566.1 pilus assembly PilX N-terminal domain-containing protein [Geoalkalibacter halelectricus]
MMFIRKEKNLHSPPRLGEKLTDQSGMALVLAVGMLLILTVLGAVVWTATNRQIDSAGFQQANQQAFFATQRALEYAVTRDILLNLTAGQSVDLTSSAHKANINAGNSKTSGGGEILAGEIFDDGPGEMPLRLRARYGSDFGANYYFISVSAEGPRGSREDVETQVVRLFKHDDDSLFITTGGG